MLCYCLPGSVCSISNVWYFWCLVFLMSGIFDVWYFSRVYIQGDVRVFPKDFSVCIK
jgi:hypothetical protein